MVMTARDSRTALTASGFELSAANMSDVLRCTPLAAIAAISCISRGAGTGDGDRGTKAT